MGLLLGHAWIAYHAIGVCRMNFWRPPTATPRFNTSTVAVYTGSHSMNSRSGIGMTSARTRARLIERLRGQGIRNADVLAQIRAVPRHLFVDEALASRAYEDTALPIGHGQTISQPYIVARMTEALLEAGPVEQVLEIGSGCGYQTAVLASNSRQAADWCSRSDPSVATNV